MTNFRCMTLASDVRTQLKKQNARYAESLIALHSHVTEYVEGLDWNPEYTILGKIVRKIRAHFTQDILSINECKTMYALAIQSDPDIASQLMAQINATAIPGKTDDLYEHGTRNRFAIINKNFDIIKKLSNDMTNIPDSSYITLSDAEAYALYTRPLFSKE